MTPEKLDSIASAIQPEDETQQFYIVVDGNHRFVVWKEL